MGVESPKKKRKKRINYSKPPKLWGLVKTHTQYLFIHLISTQILRNLLKYTFGRKIVKNSVNY